MNLYYLLWSLLIAVSLYISLTGFFWALRHGQFNEQERARYLPFRGEQGPVVPGDKKGKKDAREVCIMVGIIFLGVGGLCAAAITMILTTMGVRP